eukprot:ctg_2441.g443
MNHSAARAEPREAGRSESPIGAADRSHGAGAAGAEAPAGVAPTTAGRCGRAARLSGARRAGKARPHPRTATATASDGTRPGTSAGGVRCARRPPAAPRPGRCRRCRAATAVPAHPGGVGRAGAAVLDAAGYITGSRCLHDAIRSARPPRQSRRQGRRHQSPDVFLAAHPAAGHRRCRRRLRVAARLRRGAQQRGALFALPHAGHRAVRRSVPRQQHRVQHRVRPHRRPGGHGRRDAQNQDIRVRRTRHRPGGGALPGARDLHPRQNLLPQLEPGRAQPPGGQRLRRRGDAVGRRHQSGGARIRRARTARLVGGLLPGDADAHPLRRRRRQSEAVVDAAGQFGHDAAHARQRVQRAV